MALTSVHAMRTLYNNIAEDTYHRYMAWLCEHQHKTSYCYWSREDKPPIDPDDIDKPEIRDMYPEIKDFAHHTRVRMDNQDIILFGFCDRYKDTIAEMLKEGIDEGVDDNIKWTLRPDTNPAFEGNYILILKKA